MVHTWLQDLHFEDYYHLFVGAGYDMPTISRMTPEVKFLKYPEEFECNVYVIKIIHLFVLKSGSNGHWN